MQVSGVMVQLHITWNKTAVLSPPLPTLKAPNRRTMRIWGPSSCRALPFSVRIGFPGVVGLCRLDELPVGESPCSAGPDSLRISAMPDTYSLVTRMPTPGEHRSLAEAVGWSHAFEWETMPASLDGSVFGVVAIDDGQVVGMGRLVGDGIKYFYVQDLAVRPSHQGRGVGTVLLRRLLDHVARTAPATAFVGLFATPGAVSLYQRAGFAFGDMSGMVRLVEPEAASG